MYFTFGVLTMVAMLVVAVVIYSIVKVFKQEKQIKNIQQNLEDAMRMSQQDDSWFRNDMSDRFKDVYRQIDDNYTNAKDMAYAYTDMRIDKLEAKLTGTSEVQVQLNKKLIKG